MVTFALFLKMSGSNSRKWSSRSSTGFGSVTYMSCGGSGSGSSIPGSNWISLPDGILRKKSTKAGRLWPPQPAFGPSGSARVTMKKTRNGALFATLVTFLKGFNSLNRCIAAIDIDRRDSPAWHEVTGKEPSSPDILLATYVENRPVSWITFTSRSLEQKLYGSFDYGGTNSSVNGKYSWGMRERERERAYR